MKISKIETLRLKESDKPVPAGSRESWDTITRRGSQMDRYKTWYQDKSDWAAQSGNVWISITAEDGTRGLGFAPNADVTATIIETHLSKLVLERDPLSTEAISDIMWRASAGLIGGSTARAISGIDAALWDLKGNLLQEPVYKLLGGPARDYVKCYATSDDLDWSQELGFQRFKMSCPWSAEDGEHGLQAMEQKFANARTIVGDQADIAFNPVMSFDLEYAVKVAERLRPFNLRWLEEMLPPEDYEGHAELRKRAPYAVLATGEDHHRANQFMRLASRRMVDILQPDVQWCGGITELVKICHIAEATGLRVNPHFGANTPMGLHACLALPAIEGAEYWLGTAPGIPIRFNNKIPGHLNPENGTSTPPDRPGLGFEIEDDQLTPYFQ